MTLRIVLVALAFIVYPAATFADALQDVGSRIRAEEHAHSQIMATLHVLADVYGPRLTGSSNHRSAAQWAVERMAQWGMKDGHLEAWNFGHPGWENVRAEGRIVSPAHDKLTFRVAAWTPGTRDVVTAPVVLIDPPSDTTDVELYRYLSAVRPAVHGKIVMVGKYAPLDRDNVPAIWDATFIAHALDPRNVRDEPPDPKLLTGVERQERINTFLLEAGALIRVNDARRPHGLIRASANYTYDTTRSLPIVNLRHEDYGRIARILADKFPVKLSFNIQNRDIPEGRVSYNALADFPGTDKKDEVVLIGAHLDSWDLATGATDDGIGCAVMMEVGRILEALRIHPRRTIRIGLWGGEEEELNGSQDYVARHFGDAESPNAGFATLDAYINIDSGTGRIRGANVFGPPEGAFVLRQALAPYSDLGFAGAVNHSVRRIRSTDATVFSRAGLPAIGFLQDPADYEALTWHTNLDTYDSIVEADVEQQAIIIAALVYNLAMRDAMLPRFDRRHIPKPVGPAAKAFPVH